MTLYKTLRIFSRALGFRVHEATKTAAKLACLVAMWRCSGGVSVV